MITTDTNLKFKKEISSDFAEKPEGNRPLGRPMRRSEDKVQIVLKDSSGLG